MDKVKKKNLIISDGYASSSEPFQELGRDMQTNRKQGDFIILLCIS
jgi:hypothetical protein